MKKNFKLTALLLLLSLSLSLISCGGEREITAQQLAYEYIAHGFDAKVIEREENEQGIICSVQADDPDKEGEYIYFEFFETEEDAEKYIKENKKTLGIFIFSLALFDPTLITYKQHGKIVVQYEHKEHYKIFKNFIKE